MWALYGQKFERHRIQEHLDFLAPYGYDYVRILGEVGWEGETIDPAWPDYEDILGSFIDDVFEVGLRTQVTMIGGGTGHDPMDLARKVARVINAGRHEKVMSVEVGNESWQNGPTKGDLIKVARYLRTTIPNLVALSTPIPGDLASTEEMLGFAKEAGATLFTMHTDRGDGDHKWRMVRQAWDFKAIPFIVSHNEPPGPNSSVGTNDNPLQLAMMRATGVLCGAALFVLHVGDMVFGRDMPEKNRKANLWEVDNIDAILKAVRGLDPMLPDNMETWAKYNDAWAGHPLRVGKNQFWGDGEPERDGVNRNYACKQGGDFVVSLSGVKNRLMNVSDGACHVDAYDPLGGHVVASANLTVGEVWDVTGRDDTMTGYIVIGKAL